MSKLLTETSAFTATINVPLPGETVTGASVEAPFQGLTNRTRFHADELTRLEALFRSQGVQNWSVCAATEAGLTGAPLIDWVPSSDEDEEGWWCAVAPGPANIIVGLSEDECGLQDVGAIFPGAVGDVAWMAVATWDAGLGCAPIIVGGSQDDIAVQRGGLPGAPSWTTAALDLGATSSTCGVWAPSASKFVVGGAAAGVAHVWLVTTADPPVIGTAESWSADVSTVVVCMAIDVANDKIVAFGNAPGVTSDSWVITGASAATVALYTTAIDDPSAIAYSPTEELWMVIAGAASGNVYTSPDGITWTQVATAIPDLGNALSLVEADGLWLATVAGWALFSQDNGATWHRCTLNGAAGTASPNVLTGIPVHAAYSPGRRRFATVHQDAANALVMNRSLSIGLMPEHS